MRGFKHRNSMAKALGETAPLLAGPAAHKSPPRSPPRRLRRRVAIGLLLLASLVLAQAALTSSANMRASLTTLLGALAFASSAAAAPASLEARQSSLDNTRFNAMLRNIAGASSATLVPGAASGSVIASPSTDAPNYYYSWVRDSAMTFKVIIDAYIKGQHGVTRALIERWIQSEMVNAANARSSSSSLGEPKFNPDGSLFTGPWGRPQNDGPALRATAIMRYARAIGLSDSYTATLYKSDLSANSIIKSDLEYVAHHWQDSR